MSFEIDQLVRHDEYGEGLVQRDRGSSVVVEFVEGRILTVRREALTPIEALSARVDSEKVDAPLPTLLRAAALAIRSVNDRWGVFAPSQIILLPHQLWACQKVIERSRFRWMVADDVGLGKSIEAGLILTALNASQRLDRLLILAPAGLIEQWQQRMHSLFGLALSRYEPSSDSEGVGYWKAHRQVIASLQTLRQDQNHRWDRLLDAEPWDLVIVDEAHHLNVERGQHPTLAYDLLRRLDEADKIHSMVFFTGTPHRGKDYGFLSLMRLLRRDLFDPRKALSDQASQLREAMIRNNKQLVTDMDGKRIFTPVRVRRFEYRHSSAEAAFYHKLTEYIESGRAFARGLTGFRGMQVKLVLTVLQKLASSSVAAGRNALRARLLSRKQKLGRLKSTDLSRTAEALQEAESYDYAEAGDAAARLVEQFLPASDLTLVEDEVQVLEELISLADEVGDEAKLMRLLELLVTDYAERSVLIFTEYKASQAQLVVALEERFGPGTTTFINGDGALELPDLNTGALSILRSERAEAAQGFNSGKVRFLVSTEAAGEGIDLHNACHTLCHFDLPWNPMRLHQRVGRLSRFGQQHPVDVFLFLNPHTVEGRIWELLLKKLDAITEAFRGAMDDPEDMLQGVLGMTPSGVFTEWITDAPTELDRAQDWFKEKSASFGDSGSMEAVMKVFGNAARFRFGGNHADLPRVDLPDLLPFFRGFLTHHGRRAEVTDTQLKALTPALWRSQDRLLPREIHLTFSRQSNEPEAKRAGIHHALIDQAIREALGFEEKLTVVRTQEQPVVIVAVTETLSTSQLIKRLIFGVGRGPSGLEILRDWELLKRINRSLKHPWAYARTGDLEPPDPADAAQQMKEAQRLVEQRLPDLHIPMEMPEVRAELLIWGGGSLRAAS